MGKIDTESKQYFGKPEHFADAFNFLLYGGKEVISPESLTELDANEIAIPFKDKDREQIQKQRDLLKAMTDGKAIYVILGAELQSEINYAMPVKDGLYDMMNYSAQVKKITTKNHDDKSLKPGAEFLSGFKKTDKIIPVITAVIYTGAEPWDGPLTLHDMMEFEDEQLKAFVPDYKLNLISAADIPDEDFSKFNTELGFAMKLLKHQNTDADKIIEEQKKVSQETAFFLNVAANLDLKFEVEDGGVDMCVALERRYKEEKLAQERRTTAMHIKSLMDALDVDKDKAMDILKIPTEEREFYSDLEQYD